MKKIIATLLLLLVGKQSNASITELFLTNATKEVISVRLKSNPGQYLAILSPGERKRLEGVPFNFDDGDAAYKTSDEAKAMWVKDHSYPYLLIKIGRKGPEFELTARFSENINYHFSIISPVSKETIIGGNLAVKSGSKILAEVGDYKIEVQAQRVPVFIKGINGLMDRNNIKFGSNNSESHVMDFIIRPLN